MWSVILSGLFKSNAVKLSTGAIGASGVVALVLGLHQDISKRISKVESDTRSYVELKNQLVVKEVQHLKEGQTDIKKLLITIDERLYKMKTKGE